jgi:hypothetical protein
VVLRELAGHPRGDCCCRWDEVARWSLEPVEQPSHLRCAVAGVGVEAGDRVDVVGTYLLFGPLALPHRPPVHPDQGRMDRGKIVVDRHHAVDLSGYADVRDRPRRLFGQRPEDLGHGAGPLPGILLGPSWRRHVDAVSGGRRRHQLSRLGEQDALGALSADVTTDDVGRRFISHHMFGTLLRHRRERPARVRSGSGTRSAPAKAASCRYAGGPCRPRLWRAERRQATG